MRTYIRGLALPKNWPRQVKLILVHVISVARVAAIHATAHLAASKYRNERIAAQLRQAKDEISLLREEIRIKDERMRRIPSRHRPHYTPTERLAILELKAAKGWSTEQTADVFLLSPETIAHWMKMLDDCGPKALLRMAQPANKLPDLVRYIVRRLKVLCPAMGKVKIAQALVRAGLHLSSSSVGRVLRSNGSPPNSPDTSAVHASRRTIRAAYPNHVWHIDLTVVPTSGGFWTSWLPNAIGQVWPFCWWVACILDQYSRCVVGFALFKRPPTSAQLRCLLARAVHKARCKPGYIITDKGKQFTSRIFRIWCKRKRIALCYGAVGRYGSIAVIERFFRTLKAEWLRRIIIPFDMNSMRKRLTAYIRWYNCHRPHQGLQGAVPVERYMNKPKKLPTTEFNPRDKLQLIVSFHEGNRQLPIVRLRKVA